MNAECPNCSKRFKFRSKRPHEITNGEQVRCPKCRETIVYSLDVYLSIDEAVKQSLKQG